MFKLSFLSQDLPYNLFSLHSMNTCALFWTSVLEDLYNFCITILKVNRAERKLQESLYYCIMCARFKYSCSDTRTQRTTLQAWKGAYKRSMQRDTRRLHMLWDWYFGISCDPSCFFLAATFQFLVSFLYMVVRCLYFDYIILRFSEL